MPDILYADDHLVAINKPHGLLVHRSPIAADAAEFALQLLRDQLGRPVYPAHRIDRKTGGILLFALNKEVEIAMQQQFMNGQVLKKYLAIVRGYAPDRGEIDYPLKKENGSLQDAFTRFITVARAELPVAAGKHPTSRYSLVEATPETGRMHQLRRHFSHILHPIIGDRPHGCNKQNRLFAEAWNMHIMLLHAQELSFKHPVLGSVLSIQAPVQSEFGRMMDLMDFNPDIHK